MLSKIFLPSLLVLFPVFFVSCASINVPCYQIDFECPEVAGFDEEKVQNPDSIKIVQISDFHSNDFGENEELLLQKIRDVQPDLICITGDLFEFKFGEKTVRNVRLLLEGIKELCPFFYVSGNHEYYHGHNNEYAYLIEEYGGINLADKTAVVNIKGIDFVIAGVNDPIQSVPNNKRKRDANDDDDYFARLESVTDAASEREGDFYILLAHRPEYIEKYKEAGVYDLILSGHAHGGQWRLPPINGLYAPGQGLFPKYAGGRYDFFDGEKKSAFIVSRGLSYQMPAFPRLFNNPELVVIEVKLESAGISSESFTEND